MLRFVLEEASYLDLYLRSIYLEVIEVPTFEEIFAIVEAGVGELEPETDKTDSWLICPIFKTFTIFVFTFFIIFFSYYVQNMIRIIQ